MAGVTVVVTALGLSGCTYKAMSSEKFIFAEDEYIIYNRVLHKGDAMTEVGIMGGVAPTPRIVCDCGLDRGTDMYVHSKEKPQENEYDSVCDMCF